MLLLKEKGLYSLLCGVIVQYQLISRLIATACACVVTRLKGSCFADFHIYCTCMRLLIFFFHIFLLHTPVA